MHIKNIENQHFPNENAVLYIPKKEKRFWYQSVSSLVINGRRGGTWTHKVFLPQDFKSCAFANFTTRPYKT